MHDTKFGEKSDHSLCDWVKNSIFSPKLSVPGQVAELAQELKVEAPPELTKASGGLGEPIGRFPENDCFYFEYTINILLIYY